MSTISALSTASTAQRPSPRSRLDEDITAAVKAGVLSQTDASAIETALDKIDSALQPGDGSQASGTLDPKQIKARVDGLIDQQVKDGTLTSDQADELKAFFAAGPDGQDGASGTTSANTATGAGSAGKVRGGDGGAGGAAATTDTTTDTDGDGIPDYIDPQPKVYNASGTNATSSAQSQGKADTDGDSDDSKLSALKTFLHNLRQQDRDTYTVGNQSQSQNPNGSSASGQIIDQFA